VTGQTERRPVIIIGAGPVGLALLVALLRRGVPAQLYEALPELSPEARASTFHPRTLEMFDEWGVLEAVLSRGHRVDRLQYWEREGHELIAEFRYDVIAGDTPHPYRLQCPQSVVTRLLKPIAEALAPGCVHMNHTYLAHTDAGDHVVVTLQTPGGLTQVEGAYLCAADGSRSAIRNQLGLRFEGLTYPDRFLLVTSDIDFKQVYPDFASVSYIFDPQEWVIVMQLPDMTRTVFKVQPEEDENEVLNPEQVLRRIRRFTGRTMRFTIFGSSIYSVHQRVAERFRQGRVLLLGDAAHINNPMGGMGMNSGIHDAHCLAEKLALVWHGGHDCLLDEYSDARRTYALETVRSSTHKNYEDMSAQNPEYRHRRNAEFRAIARDRARQRAYLLRTSMMEERISRRA